MEVRYNKKQKNRYQKYSAPSYPPSSNFGTEALCEDKHYRKRPQPTRGFYNVTKNVVQDDSRSFSVRWALPI